MIPKVNQKKGAYPEIKSGFQNFVFFQVPTPNPQLTLGPPLTISNGQNTSLACIGHVGGLLKNYVGRILTIFYPLLPPKGQLISKWFFGHGGNK